MQNNNIKKLTRALKLIIFSFNLTANLFFYVFVHSKYDLSPNLALFIVSLIITIIEFYTINKIHNLN